VRKLGFALVKQFLSILSPRSSAKCSITPKNGWTTCVIDQMPACFIGAGPGLGGIVAGIPYTVSIADGVLEDLKRRLQMTRWPDEIGEGTWAYGMPRTILRGIIDYWRDRFDWRAAERRLNSLPQFTIEIDGRIVHYMQVQALTATRLRSCSRTAGPAHLSRCTGSFRC